MPLNNNDKTSLLLHVKEYKQLRELIREQCYVDNETVEKIHTHQALYGQQHKVISGYIDSLDLAESNEILGELERFSYVKQNMAGDSQKLAFYVNTLVDINGPRCQSYLDMQRKDRELLNQILDRQAMLKKEQKTKKGGSSHNARNDAANSREIGQTSILRAGKQVKSIFSMVSESISNSLNSKEPGIEDYTGPISYLTDPPPLDLSFNGNPRVIDDEDTEQPIIEGVSTLLTYEVSDKAVTQEFFIENVGVPTTYLDLENESSQPFDPKPSVDESFSQNSNLDKELPPPSYEDYMEQFNGNGKIYPYGNSEIFEDYAPLLLHETSQRQNETSVTHGNPAWSYNQSQLIAQFGLLPPVPTEVPTSQPVDQKNKGFSRSGPQTG